VSWVDVSGYSTTHVHTGTNAKQNLAGGRIKQGHSGRVEGQGLAFVLMHPIHFVTGARGIHVGQVQGVAVPQARGVQTLAVIIDRHGAHAEFILAIAVHIGHRDAVVALSRIRISCVFGIKHPTRGERAIAVIPCSDHCPSVPAAHKNSAGQLAIQVSDAGCEPIGTSARGVVATVAAPAAPAVQRVTGGNVFSRGQGFTCGAFEHREVFGAVHDFAVKE